MRPTLNPDEGTECAVHNAQLVAQQLPSGGARGSGTVLGVRRCSVACDHHVRRMIVPTAPPCPADASIETMPGSTRIQ